MKPGQIIRLVPLEPTWITGNVADATFPLGNLADPQPKVVARIPPTPAGSAYGLYEIAIDLQADTSVDTVALIAHFAPVGTTWSVAAATTAQGAGSLGSAPSIVAAGRLMRFAGPPVDRPCHDVAAFAPTVCRYLEVFITVPPGGAGFAIGVLAIGLSVPLDAQFNFDLGSGRKVEDLSDIRKLPDGGFGIWRKAVAPMFRATWSQLTDIEMMIDLWAMLREIGTSAPVLLIEDPDLTPGWQDRVHYAVIDSLDFYSRQQLDKSSIELKVRDWL